MKIWIKYFWEKSTFNTILTDISPAGWSMNTSSDSSPSRFTLTHLSPYSSSKNNKILALIIRPAQLLNVIEIEEWIDTVTQWLYSVTKCQVQRRSNWRSSSQEISTISDIFQYLIIINGIKWWNITLDVTDGWYFWICWSSMSTSLNVAFSNWVGPICLNLMTPIYSGPTNFLHLAPSLNSIVVEMLLFTLAEFCQVWTFPDNSEHSWQCNTEKFKKTERQSGKSSSRSPCAFRGLKNFGSNVLTQIY